MSPRPHVLALLACAFALAACTAASSGAPDAGRPTNADGGAVGGPDAGDGKCHQDADCAPTDFCQASTGKCLAAKPCQSNEQCDSEDEKDYCAYGGCFCDPARNGGSCRPRFHLCQPCTRDLECGNDRFLYLNYTASCTSDPKGAKVCLPLKATGCPPGYVGSTTDVCNPGGGSCDAAAPCTKDAECDATGERPVCDVRRGFCIAPCVFDYQRAQSDCPPGQECHLEPQLLQASNPNFGGGKCGPSCDGAAAPYVCPTTDDARSTVCAEDGSALAATRPRRCRPAAPHCIRDQDCPGEAGAHSKGYCDRTTLDCQTGCRREGDCDSGYHCLENQCVQKTCLENGGAAIACSLGQFCCGETDGPTCPTGVGRGACYDAANPPWCGSCDLSADTPGGSARPQPSACVAFTDKAGTARKMQWHSCEEGKPAECPRSWICTPFLQFCKVDADCGASGQCGDIDAGDAGKYKGCVCASGKTCPSPATCGVDKTGASTGVCEANWCDMRYCLK